MKTFEDLEFIHTLGGGERAYIEFKNKYALGVMLDQSVSPREVRVFKVIHYKEWVELIIIPITNHGMRQLTELEVTEIMEQMQKLKLDEPLEKESYIDSLNTLLKKINIKPIYV